jgi:hypothetical protein
MSTVDDIACWPRFGKSYLGVSRLGAGLWLAGDDVNLEIVAITFYMEEIMSDNVY